MNYPALPGKVDARVSHLEDILKTKGEQDISREMENSAVAELLEELLSQPSRPSAADLSTASTSNVRSNTSVPGSWN